MRNGIQYCCGFREGLVCFGTTAFALPQHTPFPSPTQFFRSHLLRQSVTTPVSMFDTPIYKSSPFGSRAFLHYALPRMHFNVDIFQGFDCVSRGDVVLVV